MTCDQPKIQLYLYLDGELAPSDAAEVEQHLQHCQLCQDEVTEHYRLQALLQEALPEEAVPEHLVSAIEAKLATEAQQAADHPARVATRPVGWWRYVSWGGAVAVAVLLLIGLTLKWWHSPTVPVVVREMVDSQIRAQLMHAPYEQVEAESGAIRRWFDGQVEFAPPLLAIPDDTYRLRGVRLNYFLNRRVAEIAYSSADHVLSFLMFSNKDVSLGAMQSVRSGDRVFHVNSHKGYNTVLWQDGEIFCSLVSDLNLEDLLQVARDVTGSNATS